MKYCKTAGLTWFLLAMGGSPGELCSFSKLSVTSPMSQLLLILKAFRHFTYAQLILQPFPRFTYVTTHSPTLPLLQLRHSSFSNPSFASPTSQVFTYVTWRAAQDRAFTKCLQRVLFWANFFTSSHVFTSFSISSATVLLKVCLGLPLHLFPYSNLMQSSQLIHCLFLMYALSNSISVSLFQIKFLFGLMFFP